MPKRLLDLPPKMGIFLQAGLDPAPPGAAVELILLPAVKPLVKWGAGAVLGLATAALSSRRDIGVQLPPGRSMPQRAWTSAEVTAAVLAVRVCEGDRIKAGDVVLRLRDIHRSHQVGTNVETKVLHGNQSGLANRRVCRAQGAIGFGQEHAAQPH